MEESIIFFDGVCNFCNASVNFIINRDPKKKFTFCSLQSDEARRLLSPHGIDNSELQTMILYKNGKHYFKSRAALEIAKDLSGLWPLFYVFIIIPPFLRDIFYNLIAKNRYKWFGKSDSCVLPTEDMVNRFVS